MGPKRFIIIELIPGGEIFFHADRRSADYPQPGVYPPHLFLQGLDPRKSESKLLAPASPPIFDPMKNRGGRLGAAGGVPT